MLLTGNSLINRLEFINIIDNAMCETFTVELVLKVFSATGVLPFNPAKIDLSQFPSSLANATPISESPVQATCSTCCVNNVQLHPLVKQGLVPKRLASVFTYTAPASKTKSRVKTVEKARIITSEEVQEEILASQKRKREGKKKENAAGKKKNTGGKKKLTSVAASKKASRKSAKSAFKKMILDKSDDEDSDSEPELSQPKRRRTVLLSDTEESGQEDDIGIVEEATIDESV